MTRWRLVLLLAVACWALPARAHEALPRELADVGIAEHLGAVVPRDLPFRNEAGEIVPLRTFFDGEHPVILALTYYGCPNLCGLLLNGLMAGLKGLAWTVGKQFIFVNVSIDPTETAALAAEKKENALKAYGRPGAEGGWHYLVGDEPHIRDLAAAVGFRYRYDTAQRQYAHAAAIYVLTPAGQIARYLYGIEFPPRDVRLALLEASGGKIGNVADRLLMFCYHYDPATRRYALVATRLMRAGGAIAVAGLAVLLVRLRRA